MVYRFLILSDEADNFKREIKISSAATFFDLHKAILETTNFKPDEMYSFFICDDDWSRKTEITRFDMNASSEVDTYLMEKTSLDELLEDENQKLLYVFDYMLERALFMELSEIIPGQTLDKPVCIMEVGNPPTQAISMDELDKRTDTVAVGEDFYGDSDFNEDEFDTDDAGLDHIFDDEQFK
ncbi:MAG: plasmid pRiA4b ORF-3 family protein [Tannerella sp.]|jgi:hypothetical protein|nr:plasmid pRiA4b ORF-3 family protein [Tannerella sp.]